MKVCIEIEVADSRATTIARALRVVAAEIDHCGYTANAPDSARQLLRVAFRVIQNGYRGRQSGATIVEG